MLVYNYMEGSWSFFIDSYTCFGPFQKNPTFTWNQLTEQTWENFNYSWENPTGQAYAPELAAGNQQGFIMGLDSQITPDSSLYISGITNLGYALQIGSPNHNLEVGQFISFKGMQPATDPTVSVLGSLVWKIIAVIDENQIVVENSNFSAIPVFAPTYFGEMLILPNVDLVSRRYSFGVGEGYQTRLVRTDFFVDRDETGSFSVEIFVDEDSSLGVYYRGFDSSRASHRFEFGQNMEARLQFDCGADVSVSYCSSTTSKCTIRSRPPPILCFMLY